MAKKRASKRALKKSSKASKASKASRKARKPARKIARKTARKPVKATARKSSRVTTRRKAAPKKPVRKASPQKLRRPAPKPPAPIPAAKAAGLQRERRRLPDVERLDANRDMGSDRMMAAAKSGHKDLKSQLEKHTETSPTLTAGDLDAKWQDAYAVGDEAPGGDNPTPDQDRVDDIGKALGVTYQDDQELQGGDEIGERDHKRWELDPASSDDWPHKE